MYSNSPINFKKNERNGPDFLMQWIYFVSLFGWFLIFSVMVLTHYAKPQMETFFDRYFNVEIRYTWNIGLMNAVFIILILLFILSIIAILFNTKRLKRKTDKIHFSPIISFLFSVVGIVWYLLIFLKG